MMNIAINRCGTGAAAPTSYMQEEATIKQGDAAIKREDDLYERGKEVTVYISHQY